MANVYTNYKAVLTTSELTTLYTVGSETTSIIKSLRVTNVDEDWRYGTMRFDGKPDGLRGT